MILSAYPNYRVSPPELLHLNFGNMRFHGAFATSLYTEQGDLFLSEPKDFTTSNFYQTTDHSLINQPSVWKKLSLAQKIFHIRRS